MEDFDVMLDLVCKHYDCELIRDWHRVDFYIYSEYTADGYEVYIATDNPERIDISSDVHYYDYQLSSKLSDALRNGYRIYVDDIEASYVEDAITELYEELIEEEEEEDEE